ncbi:MAG: coproporphyrinogen dehydrogenase HemZ [Clostridia bacterium]|nr:coproporphyrinogen dehydrogenase HemZ [Clostridia bacterium]
MKLFIDGKINRYYIQTLCMIFFPGAKFAEDEELLESTDVLRMTVRDVEGGIYARAEVTSGGKTSCGERTEPFSSERTAERTAKIACGVAIFKAGEALFGCTPPWGILTGVRPAKMAEELLADHGSITAVRDVLCKEYFVNPKKASLLCDIVQNEAKLISSLGKKTCSVYISIPFCPSRCAYCSFVSYSTKRLLSMIDDYMVTLCKDIDRVFSHIRAYGFETVTVYIGGGTPSILSPAQLSSLMEAIGRNTDVHALREFTLEAGRPDTITAEKLRVAIDGGVNRISVNPQTLNDSVLEGIGRNHTVEDFFRAYNIARESGIKYINTDLIAGLPGESFSSFSRSVDQIIKLRPENLTFHTFCVKKASDFLRNGTEIYSRNGGETGKSVDYSQVSAGLSGYIPYYIYRQKNTVGNFENVGYALPGCEGLYNVFMMEEVHTVFSAGAGSITKMVAPGRKTILRADMPKYPYEYLNRETHDRAAAAVDKMIDDFCAEHFAE